jgi:hypothetical protein
MKIKLIVPRWPENSFWDVITFKFPLLGTSLLAGLTPEEHQVSIVDESLTPIDFAEEVGQGPLRQRGHRGSRRDLGRHPGGCSEESAKTLL